MPTIFLGALLITGSKPWAVCGCSACAALLLGHIVARRRRQTRQLQAVAAELLLRKKRGMPLEHPERMTYLSNDDEGKLAWLRKRHWPEWEYEAIIAEERGRRP